MKEPRVELTAEQLASMRSPFDDLVGVRMESASSDEAVASLTVTPSLHQPGGIVHGGVYAAMAEGVASTGATLWIADSVEHAYAVGVSNHTDFLRPVREGVLRCVATPLQRGRRLQLWQALITDERERLIAHTKVKLMNLTP
jgi:1,4-dihydroxy-2-naphthoyl-CoA hydrolase